MTKKINDYLYYNKLINENEGTENYNNVIANYLYMYFQTNQELIYTKDLVIFLKENTDLSNKSINKCIKLLRQVYNHFNITYSDINDFKLLKEKHNRRETIKKEDLAIIFKYINNMNDRGNAKSYVMLTYVLYDTGVRPNELLNLKTDNVNIAERSIYLEKTKTGDPRFVFMSAPVTKKLAEYLKDHENEYLFYNSLRDRQFTKDDLKSFWRRVKKATGIKKLNTYMFRHTYITDLVDLDVPIVVIQNQAGHTNYKTTMIYYHASTKNQKKHLKNINREL